METQSVEYKDTLLNECWAAVRDFLRAELPVQHFTRVFDDAGQRYVFFIEIAVVPNMASFTKTPCLNTHPPCIMKI